MSLQWSMPNSEIKHQQYMADLKSCAMKKSLLQLILATAMCIFGCALLVAGLALPPAGIIDSSLLVAYGETLTFAGALIGVDYHYRYRHK